MRILVVDDDALAGEMTRAILEELGYEVASAEDGVEAMRALDADRSISLIVCDLNMPLVSGLDLFRELRGQGLETPFILLSGDDPSLLGEEALALDACLLKDSSLGEALPAAIAASLSGKGILER